MHVNWRQRMWYATTIVLAMALGVGIAKAQSAESDEYYELMRVFVDTFQEIDRNYVKEVDRRKLVEAAVRGMLEELDPYSDYIGPSNLKQFTESVEQEFSGVGIRVKFDKTDRSIEVTSPLPGSPAYEAGIHAGDKIIEIEGQAVKDFEEGREIETAVKMLRGEEGEAVTLGIRHIDSEEVQQVTLKRAVITLDTVLGDKMKDDGSWDLFIDQEQKIAYIRLTHFTRRSADEMRTALRQLSREGMQGLILDLRFNPGGLLQAAVEVSDLFIPEGVIVTTEGRNVKPRTFTAKRFNTYTEFPMAVLVNRFSASASEIVSACLQDHKRAVVIGERSFGKGSVQNVIDLEEGKAVLKLTTASYHRPSGKNIHRFEGATEADEWGVTPDDGFLLSYTPEELRAEQLNRRARDIPGGEADADQFDDRQLTKAIDYIRAKIQAASSTNSDEQKTEEPQPPSDSEEAPATPAAPESSSIPLETVNDLQQPAA